MVDEFYQQFDAIRFLVEYTETGVPEVYFSSLFVNGLLVEVQAYIKGFCPFTVIEAYPLACIFEYSLRHSVKQIQDYSQQWKQANVIATVADESSFVVDPSSIDAIVLTELATVADTLTILAAMTAAC